MKKTHIALGVGTLAVIATAGTVSTVLAYQGEGGMHADLSSEEREAMHQEMETIMDNKDYEAWKEHVESRPKMTDYINEENFDKFAEAWELKQNGQHEEARAIMEELGVPAKGRGIGKGMGKGMHKHDFQDENENGIPDHREEVESTS